MPLTTRYGFANTPTPGNPLTAWTTVSVQANAGTNTATVNSAAPFPSAVEFDIVVGDLQLDGTLTNSERAHVLSVAGNVFTIQGTWSLTHLVGEEVYHELSATGLANSPGAMTDSGDTPYLGADGRMKRLGIGGAGQLLYVSAGVPAWSGTMLTWNPADQVAETPNLQLFSSSNGTQGYLMEVDSTSNSAANPEQFYPRMFHSVFNMNGTGRITNKRVIPVDAEVFNNSTGTIDWSSSGEFYAENISNGNWGTMVGVGSRLFNDGSGTVTDMVAFQTSPLDHFPNGNYGGGTITSYTAFDGHGVNNNGTYGAVYGLHLLSQVGLNVTGNNHAINYNDIFIVDSTGAVYNGIHSSQVTDYNGSDYAAPVLAGLGAGNVSNGTHRYKFTLENTGGTVHTSGGGTATVAVTVVNNAVNGQVTVTVPAQCLSPQTVSFVRIYRDKNSDGVYKLVGTAGACFRTFTDNVADGSLGATIPTTNNTEEPVLLFSNASVGNAASADLQYNHHVPLYNPPIPGHSSDEFTYYYIFPQDRLTTDTPHKGIILEGNFNSATATVYETEGGKLVLQGGAEATGGFAFIGGGAAFSGTDGGDALESSTVTCFGSTATTSGAIEITTGSGFAAAASNLNAGNIRIFSGTPANAGTFGNLTMDLWANITLSASTSTVVTRTLTVGTAGTQTGAVLLRGTTSGTVTLSTADAAGTHTIKLPTADGTNGQVLQTNGSGQWSFTTVSGGITIGTTTITSGTSGRVLYDNAGVVGEMTTTGSGTQLVLSTGPTMTGPVTITEAVGSSALTLTGATQTSSFPVLNATQTWNNAGTTFSAIKLNVTNTASAAASKVIDLQIGSANVLNVDRSSALTLNTGNNAMTINTALGGFQANFVTANGTELILQGGVFVGTTTFSLGWSDVVVKRDAADIWAHRRTTNAQAWRLYNTFTSTTSYERLELDWITTANTMLIGTQKGSGGGTARVMSFVYGGTTTAAISVPITSGVLTVAGGITDAGSHIVESGTAIPAGGTAAKGYMFSSTANYGIFFGSGAPSLSAAKGSLYLRSDGTGTTDRAYINTNGSTTWTALTTVA